MDIHPAIIEAIKKSNLVFFIGSGFSRQLGLPVWARLVKIVTTELSQKYPADNSIVRIAEQFEMKKVTELEALDALDAKYHNAVLEIVSRTLDAELNPKDLKEHQKLWQITDQIITTNYDKALETALPQEIEVIINEDDRGIARLSTIDHYLFKVHGCISHPTSCILFSEQYRKIYDGKTGVTLELFKILTDKTIIFLGFSLSDPFVNELLQLRQTAYKGLKQNNFIITTGIQDFSKLGVERIISINNYGKDLRTFLDKLIKIRKEYPYGFSLLMRGLAKEGKTFDEQELRKDYDGLVEQLERDPSNAEIAKIIRAGSFGKAEKKLKEKLKYNRETVNEKIKETASTLFELAKLKKLQLEYDEARDYYKEAVELQPKNSLYRNELGVILDLLGECDDAQAEYNAALEINMKNDDPSDVAVNFCNKGGSLLQQGKYEDAIKLFTLALRLAEKDFDQNAELIASLHGYLAGAYLEMGELDKVREALETAVAMGMMYKSTNQFEKMGGYINTAGLMHFQRKEWKDALKCFKNALGFMESKGKNHPFAAVINNNIGNVHLSLGHYRKAMGYFKKSLQIARDVFDDYHPTIVAHYFSIGNCLGKMGKLDDALEYFESALNICETIYTTAHPDTALAYHNIGTTLSESGNDEDGMEYLEKSIAMNKIIYGENHPRLAENYMDIGSIMIDRENYQQALSYFEKTSNISSTMLGPDHADTMQARQLIALCRKKLNGE